MTDSYDLNDPRVQTYALTIAASIAVVFLTLSGIINGFDSTVIVGLSSAVLMLGAVLYQRWSDGGEDGGSDTLDSTPAAEDAA